MHANFRDRLMKLLGHDGPPSANGAPAAFVDVENRWVANITAWLADRAHQFPVPPSWLAAIHFTPQSLQALIHAEFPETPAMPETPATPEMPAMPETPEAPVTPEEKPEPKKAKAKADLPPVPAETATKEVPTEEVRPVEEPAVVVEAAAPGPDAGEPAAVDAPADPPAA